MIPRLESVKIRKSNPTRELLARRTQPNPKSYYNRLGYNTAVSSYTGSTEIARLSGSSINRAESKKRKDELKKLLEGETQILEKVGQNVSDYLQYRQEITDIRANIIIKCGAKKPVPKSHGKRGMCLHVLSPRSKGKLRDKCTAFYRSCGKQKTFATLTFISPVTDRQGVEILNKFLTQLREDYGKLKYLWVAERQQETQNIHFHIILNQRLPVRYYNSLWVMQQYNAGLRFGSYDYDAIALRRAEGTIHEILNPFDIKKIKSIYGLSFYLTKYITKNNSGEGFKCLAWHCSRSVSKLFTKTICSRSCMSEVRSFKNVRVDYKTGEIREAKSKTGAFYQLYYIENKPYFLPEMAELERVNKWILDGWFPDEIPKESEYSIIKFYCN